MIRVLHVLPRSGGTIISRCLGSMPGNLVLSEIHPHSINKANKFNPMIQAHKWFGLLNTDDISNWHSAQQQQVVDFTASIRLIVRRAEEHHKQLVIREYSQADYIRTPRTEPSYISTTCDLLQGKVNLVRVAVVRHPLQQWRSFEDYRWLQGRCFLTDFLRGYLEFAKMSARVGFIRYEDFCRDPGSTLEQLCTTLHLNYDPTYAERWQQYKFVTGDESRTKDTHIGERQRSSADEELLETLLAADEYHLALELLGYSSDLKT